MSFKKFVFLHYLNCTLRHTCNLLNTHRLCKKHWEDFSVCFVLFTRGIGSKGQIVLLKIFFLNLKNSQVCTSK